MTVVVLCPIGVELVPLIQVLPVRRHVEVQFNHLPVLQKNGALEQPRIFNAFLVDSNPAPMISGRVDEQEAGILERVPREP